MSIVNNVVMNAMQPKITNTTTFTQMLKLTKEYCKTTTSIFNCIQQWLNLKQDKDQPVSSYMECLTELAMKTEIDKVSGEEWIVHRLHQTISRQVLKEIKSYLDPVVTFDKATVCQIITAAMQGFQEPESQQCENSWR